jgi:hypothetical protein
MNMSTVTLDSVWASAQLLSERDRNILRRRLSNSISSKDEKERKTRLEELSSLAGSWKDDPRSTEDIISSIRSLRTINHVPQL